jgi:hypothetical protein
MAGDLGTSSSQEALNQQLQVLDVHIVDVLSHLEALLRHSHTIQRTLLKLRAEAPPPTPASVQAALPVLDVHSRDMRQECEMLGEIIRDLAAGVEDLGATYAANPAKR